MSTQLLLLLVIVVLPAVAAAVIVTAALLQKPTRQWKVEWQQNASDLRRPATRTVRGGTVKPRPVTFDELWASQVRAGGYVDSVASLIVPSPSQMVDPELMASTVAVADPALHRVAPAPSRRSIFLASPAVESPPPPPPDEVVDVLSVAEVVEPVAEAEPVAGAAKATALGALASAFASAQAFLERLGRSGGDLGDSTASEAPVALAETREQLASAWAFLGRGGDEFAESAWTGFDETRAELGAVVRQVTARGPEPAVALEPGAVVEVDPVPPPEGEGGTPLSDWVEDLRGRSEPRPEAEWGAHHPHLSESRASLEAHAEPDEEEFS